MRRACALQPPDPVATAAPMACSPSRSKARHNRSRSRRSSKLAGARTGLGNVNDARRDEVDREGWAAYVYDRHDDAEATAHGLLGGGLPGRRHCPAIAAE